MAKPVLEAPLSIEIGPFYNLKVVYSDPQYNPAFAFFAQESLFDKNDGRSVTIQHVSNGRARIKFNEYGSYKVIVKMTNGPVNADLIYSFPELARQGSSISEDYSRCIAYIPNLSSASMTEPTGVKSLTAYGYSIQFGVPEPMLF